MIRNNNKRKIYCQPFKMDSSFFSSVVLSITNAKINMNTTSEMNPPSIFTPGTHEFAPETGREISFLTVQAHARLFLFILLSSYSLVSTKKR